MNENSNSETSSSEVAIIVGSMSFFDFRKIALLMPVWAPKSPEYNDSAQKLRSEFPNTDVTLYNAETSNSPEQEFLSWLSIVDLHHGEVSSDTPWKIMNVYGARVTAEISQALSEYWVEEITATDFGFRAVRTNTGEQIEE